jgi:hypothetical protein
VPETMNTAELMISAQPAKNPSAGEKIAATHA